MRRTCLLLTQSGHRGRKVLALHIGLLAKGHNMKTKVFEPGAICAAVALLVVFSVPAYAKSGGSSSTHTRVGKTSSNATSVSPVTSSRKTQSGTLQKKGGTVAVEPKSNSKLGAENKTKKEVDALKPQLGKVDVQIKDKLNEIDKMKTKQTTETDRIKSQQEKSGSIQKNLEAEAEKRQEMNKAINCLANC